MIFTEYLVSWVNLLLLYLIRKPNSDHVMFFFFCDFFSLFHFVRGYWLKSFTYTEP